MFRADSVSGRGSGRIAAVAANVGSGERITAGRPGSWESAAVEQLVTGAVGYEVGSVELADRRTMPVLCRSTSRSS